MITWRQQRPQDVGRPMRRITYPTAVGFGAASAYAAKKIYGLGKRVYDAASGSTRSAPSKKQRGPAAVKVENNGGSINLTKPYRRKRVKKSKSLKEDVKALKKKVASIDKAIATYTEYNVGTAQYACTSSVCSYDIYAPISVSILENMLSRVPMTLDSSPSTTQATDIRNVAYTDKIKYNWYGMLHLRNNYLYPANVDVYCIEPKVDTSISPATFIASVDGFTFFSGGDSTDYLCFPTMFDNFNKAWKIVCHEKTRLEPGAEFVVSSSGKGVYDPKDNDAEALTYRVGNTQIFLVRLSGVIAHEDLTPGTIGTTSAKLDAIYKDKIVIRYPNLVGTDMKRMNGNWCNILTTPEIAVDSAEVEVGL